MSATTFIPQVLLSGVLHKGREIALMTFNVSIRVNSPTRMSYRTSLGWVLMAIRIRYYSTLLGFLDTAPGLQTFYWLASSALSLEDVLGSCRGWLGPRVRPQMSGPGHSPHLGAQMVFLCL